MGQDESSYDRANPSGYIVNTWPFHCNTDDCHNLIYENDNYRKLFQGYECESCMNKKKRTAEQIAERQKRKIEGTKEYDKIRKETEKLPNYIGKDYEYGLKHAMVPSNLSYMDPRNNWAEVDYEYRIVHRHKYYDYQLVMVMKYCKIFCKAKNHVLFDKDENNWPEENLEFVTDAIHYDVYPWFALKECPECKKEKNKVKAIVNNFKMKQENILNELNNSTNTNINLSEITKLEIDLIPLFKDCTQAIESVSDIVQYSQSIVEEEESNVTYVKQADLDEFIAKAESQQQKMSQKKKDIFRIDKQLNEKQINIIQQENKINEDLIREKKHKTLLNQQNQYIDKLQEAIRAIIKDNTNKSNDVDKLNELIQELIKLLHEKYAKNEQRIIEITECKQRIGKIRAKLDTQQSENKYLIDLLNKEYDRLSIAAENAMKKFEQNGIYFLAVTVGLKQDTIDKFVEFGCDKLDDITDMNKNDLIEIGIASGVLRKKILKSIRIINQKSTK